MKMVANSVTSETSLHVTTRCNDPTLLLLYIFTYVLYILRRLFNTNVYYKNIRWLYNYRGSSSCNEGVTLLHNAVT